MRHVETLLVDLLVAVDEEVEVDGSRPPPLTPDATERALDPEQQLEKSLRRETRVDRDGAVQERRLIDDADRVRLAELGDADHVDAVRTPEELDGAAEGLFPWSKVRADPDVRERQARVRSTTTAA